MRTDIPLKLGPAHRHQVRIASRGTEDADCERVTIFFSSHIPLDSGAGDRKRRNIKGKEGSRKFGDVASEVAPVDNRLLRDLNQAQGAASAECLVTYWNVHACSVFDKVRVENGDIGGDNPFEIDVDGTRLRNVYYTAWSALIAPEEVVAERDARGIRLIGGGSTEVEVALDLDRGAPRPRHIVDETARLHRDGRDWPENADAAVVVASEKVGRLTVALELTVSNESIRVPVEACTLREWEQQKAARWVIEEAGAENLDRETGSGNVL